MKFAKKKILLVNSYAVNNGDMALVIALYNQLTKRGYEVSIATFYYSFLHTHYPHVSLIPELLDGVAINSTWVKKIFLAFKFRLNKTYRNHDMFIASPGGYVNSYYGIKRSLLALVHAHRDKKKTAIYSQSIGPLNNRDRKLLSKFSNSIDMMLVRDDYSMECVRTMPIQSKIIKTKDAAFLLPPRASRTPHDCKTVAVSVREWGHDNRNMNQFYSLIETFCLCALQEGFSIEFISTCQGVPNYRDDSVEAQKIALRMLKKNPEYAQRIIVDTDYHTYDQLVERLNTRYAFTIGTRLHMCILSLLNGTPALNISYEVKGIECYKYLSLAKYSIDFNEESEVATQKFEEFLSNHKALKIALPDKLMAVHQEAINTLEEFLKEMNGAH